MAWMNAAAGSKLIAAALLRSKRAFNPSHCRRALNTDLSTALRPFYFAVHPDFFGKHPHQRQTNEESLKLLSAHLESLSAEKFANLPDNRVLKFYMRVGGNTACDAVRIVQIQVNKNTLDPKAVIQNILETCNLDTPKLEEDFMPPLPPPQEEKVIQTNLDNWISETAAKSQLQSQELVKLKAEVLRLEQFLMQTLGLRETRYGCGWNIERYHDCLRQLEQLAQLHAQQLEVLRDRIIVFAPYTGISLEGNVMLFTGDAPSSWLSFISAIEQHEIYLKLVPLYEQALSATLLGIQIKRRHFIPTTEAKAYANRLLKVITALNDHLNGQRLPQQLPKSLTVHKLAIVPEGEQPKVSFTGLFLAPASSTGGTLIDFISTNLDIASDRVIKYKKDISIERELWTQCKEALRLHNLTKDDSVTPDKMILTLRHLLKSESKSYQDISIHVTNYYSVLTDGIVCIPWDFMYRKAERKSQ